MAKKALQAKRAPKTESDTSALAVGARLRSVREQAGMSQRELGARLNLKDAAIGKAIDALERSGLIVRKKDATDRRKALVCLTAEGREISETVAAMRSKFQAVIVDGFSAKEKSLFRDLLERSYENIGQFVTSKEGSLHGSS